jgi:hypothetical protein
MLGMVFAVPVAFLGLIWQSYRTAARRTARGEALGTPGAERWEARRAPRERS